MTAVNATLSRGYRRKRLRNNLAGYAFLAPWLIGLYTLLLVLSVQTASVCGMIKMTDGSIPDHETVTATVQLESFPED